MYEVVSYMLLCVITSDKRLDVVTNSNFPPKVIFKSVYGEFLYSTWIWIPYLVAFDSTHASQRENYHVILTSSSHM